MLSRKPALAGLMLAAVAAAVVSIPVPADATPRCEGRLLMSEIGRRQEATLLLLREKQYDELQRRMDGFLDAYTQNRITDEELFYEFGAFDRWGPFLTPLLREWMERHPQSFAAHHGMALHLSSVAWRARGSDVARGTSAQQFSEFDKGLRAARDVSLRSLRLHPRPLLAYRQLMSDAKALHDDDAALARAIGAAAPGRRPTSLEPRPDVLPLLRESIRAQPDNIVVRQAYVEVLAPRWGGSLDALQDFARPAHHPGLSADRLASVSYMATMEIASDYRFRKQPDAAVALFEVAAQICRLNQPFVDIANIRLEQGRFADALTAADAASQMVPSSTSGALLRVRALRGLDRHAEAVQALQRLAPEGIAEVAYLLGEYHESGTGGLARDPAQARRLFEIAARGGDPRALRRLQSPASAPR